MKLEFALIKMAQGWGACAVFLCLGVGSPAFAQVRLYVCSGQSPEYRIIVGESGLQGCLPYSGSDPRAIAAQAKFDAQSSKELLPSDWVSLDYEADGCDFYAKPSTISGPNSSKRGFFYATCEKPREFVQGFAIRSLEMGIHADCEQRLYPPLTLMGREKRYGGHIRSWQSQTLKEQPLARPMPNTIGAELMDALCRLHN